MVDEQTILYCLHGGNVLGSAIFDLAGLGMAMGWAYGDRYLGWTGADALCVWGQRSLNRL